jgi:hypothetical protein
MFMLRKLLISLSIVAAGVFAANAGTVGGTVTAATGGAAIAGAVVTLTPTAAGGTTYTDTTTATGAYTFAAVAAGAYRISAAATGYTTSTPAAIVVTATSATTRNIALVTAAVGVTISGTVTDATNASVLDGALVILLNGTAPVESTTTAAGLYSLTGVARGTYSLQVSASGYTTQTIAGIAVAGVNVTRNVALVPVGAGVTISGTVTDTTTGAAIVDAVVRLVTGAGGAGGGTVVESTTTIAAGAYTLTGVAAGTYHLTLSATGYVAKTVLDVVVAAANVTRNVQLVEVGPGVTVSGTVTNATTSAAIVGAVVRLRTGATTAVVESTTTIAGGAYTLTAVQPGNYNLNVSANTYTPYTSAAFTVAAANITRNVTLTVAPVVSVSGYITDTVSGAAIVGAKVLLENGTTVADSATSTAGGAYTLTNVAAGTYSLVISAAGYATKTVTGVVVAGVSITGENVRIKTSTTAVIPVSAAGALAKPDFSIAPTGTIHLLNFSKGGLITLFSVDGKMLYHRTFGAQESAVALPHGLVHSGSACIVTITQDKSVYRKQAVLF